MTNAIILVADVLVIGAAITCVCLFLACKKLLKEARITLSELSDLQDAVNSTLTELSNLATQIAALEGTTPAPGVLEGLANQLKAAVAAAQAATNPSVGS